MRKSLRLKWLLSYYYIDNICKGVIDIEIV